MPRVVDIEERRHELGAAAAQLIASDGVGAATLRGVAAEAGWTTGALTHYFADKRELLLFTFTSSLAGRHAARPPLGEPSTRRSLIESLEGALPLDDDRRRHWMVTVAFCAHAAGDDEFLDAQRDAYRAFRDRIAALARESGAIAGARADAVALAERLIAVTNGIALQALFDPSGWPAHRQLSRLHETVDLILVRAPS